MAKKPTNVNPYFDDFDSSKGYYKVLFKPSFALQARELTQLQTILGDQISKTSDPILNSGEYLVPGELLYHKTIDYVKLSTDSTSFHANVTLANLPGTVITDGTLTAKVIAVEDKTASDQLTLFVTYLKGNDSDVLYANSDTLTTATGSYTVGTVSAVGTGSAVQVRAGSYYINGVAVNSKDQTLILDKYTSTPSYRIGFNVAESFVDSASDSTLNDNASGSANHLAPGADRYKVELTLTKRSLSTTTDANNRTFVEICRVVSGTLQETNRYVDDLVTEAKYSERDADENGNYIVDEFDIEIREHNAAETDANGIAGVNSGGDSTKLAFGVGPGKAVINGNVVDLKEKQYVSVDKTRGASDLVDIAETSLTAGIQNFQKSGITSTSVSGEGTYNFTGFFNNGSTGTNYTAAWTVDYTTGRQIIQFADADKVYDPYQRVYLGIFKSVKEDQTNNAVERAPSAKIVATARIRDMRRVSPGELNYHIFDIQPYNNVSEDDLAKVDVICTDSAGRQAISLLPSNFKLEQGGQSPSIFNIGFGGVRKANGISITNVRRTQTYQPSGGTLTATTPSSETFSMELTAGNTPRDIDKEKVVVFGPAATGLRNVLWTSDVLDIQYNAAKTSMTIKPLNNTLVDGYDRYSLASLTARMGGLSDGDIFRIYNAACHETKERDGALIQYGRSYMTSSPAQNVEAVTASASTGLIGTADFTILYPGRLLKLPAEGDTFSINPSKSALEGLLNTTVDIDKFVIEDVYIAPAAEVNSSKVALNLYSGNNSGLVATAPVWPNSTDYDVIYNVDKGVGSTSHNTKTLKYATKYVTGSSATDEYIELDYVDIVSKKGKWKVFESTEYNVNASNDSLFTNDITDHYELDTGQRDEFYGLGRIKLKEGYSPPNASIKITYWYFRHGNSGDYFSVASYPSLGSSYSDGSTSYGNFDIGDIPEYISSGGKRYWLNDCIDFRASKSKSSSVTNSSGNHFDLNDTTLAANFFELPTESSLIRIGSEGSEANSTNSIQASGSRIDKIYMDQEGNVGVKKGTAYRHVGNSPDDPEDSIVLFTSRLKPFVYDTNDVYPERVQNKKYTLSDLKNIEQRLEEVERFNVLSPLEQEAINSNHSDLHVSGFWVDPFMGHDVGDVKNENYLSAIDFRKRELRPAAHVSDLGFGVENITNDMKDNTNLITVEKSSDETEYVNLQADDSENIRTGSATTYYGYMKLSPFADRWKSSASREDLLYDNDGSFASIKDLPDSSKTTQTVWNDWKTFWTGVPKDLGNGIRDDRTLDASSVSSFEPETQFSLVKNSIPAGKEIAKNYIPYMRRKTINISVYGMKPSTKITSVVFDGRDILSLVNPSTSDYGSGAGSIKTNASGEFFGNFIIPNKDENSSDTTKFRSGKKVLKLSGSGMECQAVYDSSGYISNTGTTLAYEISPKEQVDELLGQEIVVEDDCFISKVDLYFKTTDSHSRQVIVQIRRIEDGKLSREVLPYSTKFLNSSAISTTAATTVTFDEFIYLKKGSYALTLYSASDDISLHSLKVDQQSGSRPRNIGNLYKGNYKYTNKILKFHMYRVKFNTGSGNFYSVLKSSSLPNITLPKSSVFMNATNGTNTMLVKQDGHGYKVGDVLQMNGFTGTTTSICTMGSDSTAQSWVNATAVGSLVYNNTNKFDSTRWGYVIARNSSSTPYTITVAMGSSYAFDTNQNIKNAAATTQQIVGAPTATTASCNGVPITTLNNAYYKVTKSDIGTYVVRRASDSAGTVGVASDFTTRGFSRWLPNETGVTVLSSKVRADLVYYLLEQIQPTGTTVTVQSGSGFDASTGNLTGTVQTIDPNQNNTLKETLFIGTNHYLKATFTTGNDRISPAIDKNTLTALCVSNKVNKPDFNDYIGSSSSNVEIQELSNGKIEVRATLFDDTGTVIPNPEYYIKGSSSNHSNTSESAIKSLKAGDIIHLGVSSAQLINYTSGAVLGNQSQDDADAFITTGNRIYVVTHKSADGKTAYVKNPDNTPITDHANSSMISFPGSGQEYQIPLSKIIGFVPDTNPSITSTQSNYISKKVKMAGSAQYVKVLVDAKIPTDNSVDVYVRYAASSPDASYDNPKLAGIDSLQWSKVPFKYYDGYHDSVVPVLDDGEWHGFEFMSAKLPYFNQFQIKIVFTGTRTLDVSRLKNLKVFALV